MSDSLRPHGLYGILQAKYRVGSLSLLQRIFPTQESNQGLLRCRWILYQLSYQGNPILNGAIKSILVLTPDFNMLCFDNPKKK